MWTFALRCTKVKKGGVSQSLSLKLSMDSISPLGTNQPLREMLSSLQEHIETTNGKEIRWSNYSSIFTAIPNSFSCLVLTSEGELSISDIPEVVLGKAITSRMLSVLVSDITILSNPNAIPP